MEQLLVLCDFDQVSCAKSDFHTFAHDVYGICHTFNHGLNTTAKTTSHIGAEYGLKLVLFVDQDEYVGASSSSAGVRIAIHEPNTIPFPEEHGFDAAAGTSTAFAMRANKVKRTIYPWNNEDCRDNTYQNVNATYNGK